MLQVLYFLPTNQIMKSAKRSLVIFLALFISQEMFAQDSIPPVQQPVVSKKEKTSLMLSSNFASKLHYYGRTDSLKSTALVPNILLQFGNGIFLSSSFIFINNRQQAFQYTATVAGAGFNFGKTKGIAGSIYADKFFYANNTLVQSSQQGQAGFKLSHLNKILNLNLGASTVFADKSDYFASLAVDHIFKYRYKKAVFVIIPTIAANAGTQNFTHSYYKVRNVFGIPAGEELVTESGKRFQLLSYEASIPMAFAYKKLIVSFTPGYVIPQSVIKVEGRPDLSENAADLFYANLGVAFKFGKK
jgi:hypothetical protein